MLEFLRDLAAAFAMGGKVAEQDKGRTHGPSSGATVRPCEMCRREPGTGTRKMADGSWKRVGVNCKKAMGNQDRPNLIKQKEERDRRKAARDARRNSRT